MSGNNKQGEEMDLKDAKSVDIDGTPHLIIPDAEIAKLRKLEEGSVAYNEAYAAVMIELLAEGNRRFAERVPKGNGKVLWRFTVGTDPEKEDDLPLPYNPNSVEKEVTNGDEK